MNRRRLESILRVRRIQEQQARGALAASRAEHRSATELEQAARTAVAERGDALVAAPLSSRALLGERAIVHAGMLATATRAGHTAVAAVAVGERHEAWSVTARRVDALERADERLREREHEEHDRLERMEIDDLSSARHARGDAR